MLCIQQNRNQVFSKSDTGKTLYRKPTFSCCKIYVCVSILHQQKSIKMLKEYQTRTIYKFEKTCRFTF